MRLLCSYPLRDENGFTLVEVVLTMLFIAVLAVSISGLLSQEISRQRKLMDNVLALGLAQDKMERLLYDKKVQGYPFLIQKNYPEENLSEPKGFRRQVSFYPRTADLKKVVVTVWWYENKDSLVTFLGNY